MKKIISLVLSVLLVVSCMAVPTFAAEDSKKSNLTEQQFGILKITEAAIESSVAAVPDEVIQRGVAARRFAKFGNFRYSTSREYEALFYDLSTDNYYYYYIKGCYDNGVMNGYPDGTFRPNDPISTLETAKVLLYTLGYKEYIDAMGIQYVMNQTDLMDGISEISEEMTYTDFYRMMYNAYQAPYCLATEYTSDGSVKCEIRDDYTALEYLWGIKKGDGVVDGAVATMLECPDDTMLSDMISIDGERYTFSGNSTDYLGYNVNFYYKENQNNRTGGKEVVYIYKTDKNRTIVLDHDMLEDYSNFTFRYVENNKYEKVEITETTDVIYNGVACPMFTDGDMRPTFGSVTLIDNDKAKGYEVVIIENHEFYLVESIDAVKMRVTDQNEDVPVLDMENADLVTIKWNGMDYEPDRILKGNLLKVQRTKPDCGYYVCDIEVFKNEKNNVTVIKATNDYVSESTFEHPIWTFMDSESRELLKAGSIVTLYIYDGTVVRVTSEAGDTAKIGYLMNAAAEGVIDKEVSFRIMSQSATATIYNMAKSVKIDETSFKDPEEILNYLAQTAQLSTQYSEFAPYAQIVRYKTNQDGLITTIDTMYMAEKEDEDSCLNYAYPTDADTDALEKGSYYRDFGNGTIYSGSHMATFRTTAIKVPRDGAMRLDEKNYVNKLTDATYYPIEVFNLEKPIRLADYAVVYTGSVGSNSVIYSNNHDPVIIYAKNAVLNEEGEVDYSLETYHRRDIKTYKYKAEDIEKFPVLASCDVGDVVQIHEDKYGYIDGIKMVYDVSEFVPVESRLFEWGAGGGAVPVNKG